jgi:iron complex outermembrane receptor protein
MTWKPAFYHCRAAVCLFAASAVIVPAWSPPALAQETPILLPQTVVKAQKTADDPIRLPLSLTVVPVSETETGLKSIKELSEVVPNTFLNEFTARAVSNPFFRGIGGSPVNPGVTTYYDGVPQLNSFSANLELVDVETVEFVRGPQGALFGRNTPGGLINVISARPSKFWTGHAQAGYGNFASKDVAGRVSGPAIEDHFWISLAGGYSERQGYTRNLFNGEDVDSQEALFGKAQLLVAASENVEVRLLLTGERDRDGDHALGDLGGLRERPHRVNRDFTDGFVNRDLVAPTLITTAKAEALTLQSITGFVYWKNEALTDLDYGVASPANFFLNATRRNEETQDQFTQEFRLSSAENRPIHLAENVALRWQSGLFLFYRDHRQEAANTFISPLPFTSSSQADLEDCGLGLYGQARLELYERVEVSVGLRGDFEEKDADLSNGSLQPRQADGSFVEASPNAAVSWEFAPNHRLYAAVAAGYKAGGFNPPPSTVPAGAATVSYEPEHSWNYETGYKMRGLDGKLQGSASLFYIHWDDLQLNQQYPGAGPEYYIANAGAAASKGIEFEAAVRPWQWLDIFGSVGFMDAEFLGGSTAYDANGGFNEAVDGRDLPFAPDFTASAGAELRWKACENATLFLRGQINAFGEFQYDASNAEGQGARALTSFRGGIRGKHWFAEAWIANAFDTDYVPIAIPYEQLGAPSGYIGESGALRIFGARVGVLF